MKMYENAIFIGSLENELLYLPSLNYVFGWDFERNTYTRNVDEHNLCDFYVIEHNF